MCHIGSRKAKIQPQMAVSGNADLKPKFNFIHILIINENILGAFGALHV